MQPEHPQENQPTAGADVDPVRTELESVREAASKSASGHRDSRVLGALKGLLQAISGGGAREDTVSGSTREQVESAEPQGLTVEARRKLNDLVAQARGDNFGDSRRRVDEGEKQNIRFQIMHTLVSGGGSLDEIYQVANRYLETERDYGYPEARLKNLVWSMVSAGRHDDAWQIVHWCAETVGRDDRWAKSEYTRIVQSESDRANRKPIEEASSSSGRLSKWLSAVSYTHLRAHET